MTKRTSVGRSRSGSGSRGSRSSSPARPRGAPAPRGAAADRSRADRPDDAGARTASSWRARSGSMYPQVRVVLSSAYHLSRAPGRARRLRRRGLRPQAVPPRRALQLPARQGEAHRVRRPPRARARRCGASCFDYELPPELIATRPPDERDGARLLVARCRARRARARARSASSTGYVAPGALARRQRHARRPGAPLGRKERDRRPRRDLPRAPPRRGRGRRRRTRVAAERWQRSGARRSRCGPARARVRRARGPHRERARSAPRSRRGRATAGSSRCSSSRPGGEPIDAAHRGARATCRSRPYLAPRRRGRRSRALPDGVRARRRARSRRRPRGSTFARRCSIGSRATRRRDRAA